MTAQDWYREQAAHQGDIVECLLDADPESIEQPRLVGTVARLAAHFARLALGCEWTINRDRNIGETSCDNWVLMEYHTRGSYCPFCGAPIVEAK